MPAMNLSSAEDFELASALRLARAGKVDEALGSLAAQASQGNDWALGHRAWLLRSRGLYEEALADYDALLQRRPGHAETRRQRADLLRLLGRLEEAARLLLACLAEDP